MRGTSDQQIESLVAPSGWVMATGWKSAAAPDDVTVTVTYEDGVDDRSFVLGGFIDGAILEPPIPSVDWADRAGELVTLAFSRRVAAAAPATPAPQVVPAPEPDSSRSGCPRQRQAAL